MWCIKICQLGQMELKKAFCFLIFIVEILFYAGFSGYLPGVIRTGLVGPLDLKDYLLLSH